MNIKDIKWTCWNLSWIESFWRVSFSFSRLGLGVLREIKISHKSDKILSFWLFIFSYQEFFSSKQFSLKETFCVWLWCLIRKEWWGETKKEKHVLMSHRITNSSIFWCVFSQFITADTKHSNLLTRYEIRTVINSSAFEILFRSRRT